MDVKYKNVYILCYRTDDQLIKSSRPMEFILEKPSVNQFHLLITLTSTHNIFTNDLLHWSTNHLGSVTSITNLDFSSHLLTTTMSFHQYRPQITSTKDVYQSPPTSDFLQPINSIDLRNSSPQPVTLTQVITSPPQPCCPAWPRSKVAAPPN